MTTPSAQHILQIREARLADSRHADALVRLLDLMAREPAGGSQPLPAEVCRLVVPGLARLPNALVVLAWLGDDAVGMAICYQNFSTFAARPLMNIHDIMVDPGHRRRGIGLALLANVEEHARSRGCCRLTLEVRGDNVQAQALYLRFGFKGGTLMADPSTYAFLNKVLA